MKLPHNPKSTTQPKKYTSSYVSKGAESMSCTWMWIVHWSCIMLAQHFYFQNSLYKCSHTCTQTPSTWILLPFAIETNTFSNSHFLLLKKSWFSHTTQQHWAVKKRASWWLSCKENLQPRLMTWVPFWKPTWWKTWTNSHKLSWLRAHGPVKNEIN